VTIECPAPGAVAVGAVAVGAEVTTRVAWQAVRLGATRSRVTSNVTAQIPRDRMVSLFHYGFVIEVGDVPHH